MEIGPTEKGSPSKQLIYKDHLLQAQKQYISMSKISGKASKRTAWMNKEQSDIKKKEMGGGNSQATLHDSKEVVRLSRKNSRPSRIILAIDVQKNKMDFLNTPITKAK